MCRVTLSSLSDHQLLAETLNNLGCLAYMGGDVQQSILYLRESLKVQTIVSEHSIYCGSKFSAQAASLNMSITKANVGFLSLVVRDLAESVGVFESAVRVRMMSWLRRTFLSTDSN